MNPVTLLGAGAGFVLGLLYANPFEYGFHRWVLHRRSGLLRHPYQMHALLHHRVFQGDATYHVQHEGDRDLILFEWWQGLLMLAARAPAVWGLQAISGVPVFWGGMTALAVYYALYEYLHWCMHNPAGRWVEHRSAFRVLDAHHRLHHRLWRVNFNVVLPIADMVFGTFERAPSDEVDQPGHTRRQMPGCPGPGRRRPRRGRR
jgi:hypothetical protein